MQNRRVRAATAVAAVFVLALTGCSVLGGSTPDEPSVTPGDNQGALIGVAMPTKTSERWIDDGNNVKKELEALGYRVDLQYASDKVPAQQQQLESMLDNGAKALIIAAIDGTALTGQLADAGERGSR